MTKKNNAFTLIELLIVVAIIGILAAIAVPNFLNAQIKAKISRARADLRAISTAVEMYSMDNNAPPPSTHPSIGDQNYGYIRFNLTTPVSYLSTGLLPDPFVNQQDPDRQRSDELYYTYHNIPYYLSIGSFPEVMEEFYGKWRSCSYGPDQIYANGSYGVRVYDPSNGLISFGNIWVSQKTQTVSDTPTGYE